MGGGEEWRARAQAEAAERIRQKAWSPIRSLRPFYPLLTSSTSCNNPRLPRYLPTLYFLFSVFLSQHVWKLQWSNGFLFYFLNLISDEFDNWAFIRFGKSECIAENLFYIYANADVDADLVAKNMSSQEKNGAKYLLIM